MNVNLHANATTTPQIRAYIQSSRKSVKQLAQELGISEPTIRRWRSRQSVMARSHCRHHLGQSTNVEEEYLIAQLRQELALNLDDIVQVMQRCVNAKLSRSAIYRCLRRQGLSAKPVQAKDPSQSFEPTRFGFVHIDLKHLTRLRSQRSYVFVAIERTTRFVHVEVISKRDADTVSQCLKRYLKAFGFPVHTILTDNGLLTQSRDLSQ